MIRVRKTKQAFAENNENINQQLLDDQYGKCCYCERLVDTDFQIEHLQSQHNHPELINDWDNLYLACSYCNSHKSDSFDNIMAPSKYNVEEIIKQEDDSKNSKVIFSSNNEDEKVKQTIKLLSLLFNGKDGLRKTKANIFYKSYRDENELLPTPYCRLSLWRRGERSGY
ncbi:MAG: HNH endonuclease [Tannerella sp.]|jgi:uncharacterized protein (TIGR02646 family)|nr:HNH endonuclease [Tannerella sp.]